MKREYLSNLRNKNLFSQSELSKMIDLSQSYYASIETGERQQDMSLSVMEKLSSALNVPLDEFIKMEQEYKEKQ